MSALKFNHSIRFFGRLAVAVLLAVLTVGAFADQGENSERARSDESKRQAEVEKRREVERRETNQRRDNGPSGTPSVGYVTSPWALPRGDAFSGRRDDDSSRALSVGYVTSPWALPRSYTPPKDRERSCKPPKNYRPPVWYAGYYHYPLHCAYKPCRYGYWVFSDCGSGFCRRSVYFHYGIFPYVQVVRLYITPYVRVEYVVTSPATTRGYYLARRGTAGLEAALSDIRNAWISGRVYLISKHARNDVKIAVLLDGKYDYSIDAHDYVEMTSDAMDELNTVSFTWQSIRQRADDAYTAFGKHVYSDTSGFTKTVYVTYTLVEIGGTYVITEVGASKSPLGSV